MRTTTLYRYTIAIWLILACAPVILVGNEREFPEGSIDEVALSFASGYETRYFSEGRDALDGDALWTSSTELGYGWLGLGIWYGNSPDSDYDELQVAVAGTHAFGNVEFTAGFTYFEFPFEGADDKEVGISVTVPGLPFETALGFDAYYSFEAEGYFAELTLSREIISNDTFSASVAAILGNNQGYVSDGHDGMNHAAIALEAEIPLTDAIALTLHTTYSWALDRDIALDGDQQLVDFLHGGVGLSFGF